MIFPEDVSDSSRSPRAGHSDILIEEDLPPTSSELIVGNTDQFTKLYYCRMVQGKHLGA